MTTEEFSDLHLADPTLGEIVRTLAKIEARLDRVMNDHEIRLRRVERWMYAIPATLLMAGTSIVAAVLKS